jgi:hypothetical protein
MGEVLAELKKEKRSNTSEKPKGTWADIAKNSPPAYKEREALFVVKDKATLAKPSAVLVEEINQVAGEGVVQGVRILSGEKVVLAFTSKEAKAKWQGRVELKGVLGEGTESKERTLDVAVFGVPRQSIVGLTNDQLLREVEKQNPGLQAKRAVATGINKNRGSVVLVLGFGTNKEANKAIDRGTLWNSALLPTERYIKEVLTSRCFKCQKYGHRAGRCSATQERCAWCAGSGHNIKSCPTTGSVAAKSCASCSIAGHSAIDKTCPRSQQDQRRASQAYAKRERRFPVGEPRFQFGLQAGGQFTPSSSDTSEPEFTIVSRKRACCRGRPPAVSTADTTGMASISKFFSGLGPSTQPSTTPSLLSTPGPAPTTETSMVVTDW